MKLISMERDLKQYLPGLLPSGWSRLNDLVAVREDETRVMGYSGFGLVVMVEIKPLDGRHQVDVVVTRPNGIVTAADQNRVRELFQRSPLRRQVHAARPTVNPKTKVTKFAVLG